MGQDPIRHGHPNPAERLLRAAAAANLPARQRVFDVSSFPDRARVPARTPPTAAAHPDPDRRVRTRRAGPHGRNEPAGADQPRPDDQRGREDHDRGHGHRRMRADNSHHIVTAARRRASRHTPPRRRRDPPDGQCRTTDFIRCGGTRSAGLPVLALQPARPARRDRTTPRPARSKAHRAAAFPTGNVHPTHR